MLGRFSYKSPLKRLLLGLFSILMLSQPGWAASAPSCGGVFTSLSESFVYPEILRSLDPQKAHTIADLSRYLQEKLGPEVIAEAQNPQVNFMIIQGAANRPLQYLEGREVTQATEILNPFGAFNTVKVTRRDGHSSFLFTNINGESRYLQVLSFLRLAGVPAKRITIHGRLQNYHRLYTRTFQQLGHVPDLVVFGFSNTSFEAINQSFALPAQKVEFQIQNKAYAEGKWNKPRFNEHELKKMGVQVLEFSNGKKVWFLDNEYGDRAGVVMQALQDHGVRNILLLGTAGALNPKYQIGEIVAPQFFILDNGQRQLNPARASAVAKEGTHVHVESPALETKAWLQRQIERGVDFVDVELQKASEALREGTNYEAYLIVSDVLNAKVPQDYTKWAETHRQQAMETLRPILEGSLKDLGVEEGTPIKSYQIKYFDVPENPEGGKTP